MPLTKLGHSTLVVLSCVFTLFAASQPANADTTILVCALDTSHEDPRLVSVEEGNTTIELNEADSIVTVHFAANHPGPNSSGGSVPAGTVGPMHATFGPDTITLQVGDADGGPWHGTFTIDRITGQFSVQAGWQWNCKVGKKQF